MRSKVFLRCSIALSISLVILLNGVDVSAEPGNLQWALQNLPQQGNRVILNGSSIVDIAVANDGQTIYVAEYGSGLPVLKSTDSGQTFKEVNKDSSGLAPLTNSGVNLGNIAVAPDDAKTVAVTDYTRVYITNDGGNSWMALPNPCTGIYAGARITDVAISPLVSGGLMERMYAVSLADPATGAAGTTRGDILVFGITASWKTAGASSPGSDKITGVFDFTSVVFTPGFSLDRCIVSVGTKNSAGSTAVVIINTSNNKIVNNPSGASVATGAILYASGTTTEFGVIGTGIVSSGIALPVDFDPTIPGGQYGFIGIASQSSYNDNDVYRFDSNSARPLGAVMALPVQSIDYSGTIKSGRLFVGMKNDTTVKYTNNAGADNPDWVTSLKSPFGSTKTVVKVASDYPTTNRVFAGTTSPLADASGIPGAFHVSGNGGVSFDGESLINNGTTNIGIIDGIEISPDGVFLYVATHTLPNNTKHIPSYISLYRSTMPVTTTSWSLILVKEGTQGILKLSKDWTNSPYVYLADKSAGGYIYVSTDMGNTFSTRSAPAGITPTALATPNGSLLYLAGGLSPVSNYVFRSTNGAFFWDRQSDARITGIVSLAAPMTDTCIAGGDGAVSYSTDGSSTFFRIDSGLAPTPASYKVCADIDYSTSKTIFAGGNVAAAPGNIYRYIIGTSNNWENTRNGVGIPGVVVGMSSQRGAFYAMGTSSAGRTVNPLVASPTLPVFLSMKGGGVTGANWLTTAGLPTTNILYAANNGTSPQLWAFNDWLALTAPLLIGPPNKYVVPVNPSTGYAEDVTITWQPVGSGASLVNTVDFEIYRKTPEYDAGFSKSGIPVNPANPYIKIVAGATTSGNIMGYKMLPGWEYAWDIRVSNTTNQAGLTTVWSETRSIIVQTGGKISQPYAGILMTSPATGALDIDPNLVSFTWAPLQDVTEYQVIIATDAALTETVAGTPANVSNSAFRATRLEYGKTYFWAVRATKPVESVQTVGTFSTMQKPTAQLTTQPGSSDIPTPDTGNFTIPEPTGIPDVAWGVFFIGVLLLVILIFRSAAYRRNR